MRASDVDVRWPPLGPLGRGVPGVRLARGWRLGELVSSWFSAGCSALAWLAVGALGSWSPLGLFCRGHHGV